MIFYGITRAIFNSYYGRFLDLARKLNIEELLTELNERIRGLAYRDILTVVSKDTEMIINNAIKSRDPKIVIEIVDKIKKGLWKPPQEFDDAVRSYESGVKALAFLESLYYSANNKEWFLKKVITPAAIPIVGILLVYSIAMNPNDIIMISLTTFILSIIIGILVVYPPESYRRYASKAVAALEKIRRVKKGENYYERCINIIKGELGEFVEES